MIDEFTMTPHYISYHQRVEWEITAKEGNTLINFTTYNGCIEKAVIANFDRLEDPITDQVLSRVNNLWDHDLITDEEKRIFEKVFGKVFN